MYTTNQIMSMTVAEAVELGLVACVIPKSPKGELSRLIESMLMDSTLTYRDILEACRSEFSDCSTTNKSIASIASVMRKKGHDVPKRTMY